MYEFIVIYEYRIGCIILRIEAGDKLETIPGKLSEMSNLKKRDQCKSYYPPIKIGKQLGQ